MDELLGLLGRLATNMELKAQAPGPPLPVRTVALSGRHPLEVLRVRLA
jgi:hypothetical protein